MDRRTLLAVALSFLFITVWMQIFGPKPPEPGEVTDGAPTGETDVSAPEEVTPIDPGRDAAAPDAPRGSQPTELEPTGASSDAMAFEGAGTATDVRVETPLYTATFSTRGGGLTSLVPDRYELENGEPLDLVPGEQAQPQLTVDRDGPRGYAPVDMSDVVFDVRRESGGGELSVRSLTFTAESTEGVRVERRFAFRPDTYTIDIDVEVSGLPEGTEGSYSLVWAAGLPVTEATRDMDLSEFGSLVKVGENMEKEKLGHFSEGEPQDVYEGDVRWAASKAKYFLAALIVNDGHADRATAFGDAAAERVGYSVSAPIAGGRAEDSYALYVGPIQQDHLGRLLDEFPQADIDSYVGISTMPLSSIFGWFAEIVYKAMTMLYSVIPNYGVVILLLALITKLIFFPLTRKSARSMRAMSDLRPEMDAIREKYKNDPQKMNTQIFGLYKKHGVNPVAGCLPLLIQMPVFMALYGVLRSAIELRQAPFTLWVNDLSAPDTLFSFGSVPMFPDALHVLPILMAVSTMMMQSKTITDPRQKSLMYLMPVMMLFFFYNLPSGLNLYWTSQNLLAWGEQTITKGTVKPVTAKAA